MKKFILVKYFTFAVMLISAISSEAEITTISPMSSKKITYNAGKAGKAAVMNGNSKIQFPIEFLKTNTGTVEFWVKTAVPIDKFQYIVSTGFYNSQFYSIGYNAKGINFLNLKRNTVKLLSNERSKQKFAYYTNLKKKTEIFNEGKWVSLAFVWAYIKPKACMVQMYINGKLVEDRYNSTVGTEWLPKFKSFCIGFNSSAQHMEGFKGELDELRISNYPKTPSEIKKAFEAVSSGKKLNVQEGTLLLLNFEGTTDAISSTNEQLDEKQITKSFKKILKESE